MNSTQQINQQEQPNGSWSSHNNLLYRENSNSIQTNNNSFAKNLKGMASISKFQQLPVQKQTLVVAAAGAVGAIALPFLLTALPIAIAGVVFTVSLFFTVKLISLTAQGTKWAAGKTVDGIKYTAGKIKDGAVYAKNGSMNGIGAAIKGTGNGIRKAGEQLHHAGSSIKRSNSYKLKTPEHNKELLVVDRTTDKDTKFDNTKQLFEEILGNKKLVKDILSRIVSSLTEKIEQENNKVANAAKNSQYETLKCRWQAQKNFIEKLNAKELKEKLKDYNPALYGIFSEHHKEVEEAISECKDSYKQVDNVNEGIGKRLWNNLKNRLSSSSNINSGAKSSTPVEGDNVSIASSYYSTSSETGEDSISSSRSRSPTPVEDDNVSIYHSTIGEDSISSSRSESPALHAGINKHTGNKELKRVSIPQVPPHELALPRRNSDGGISYKSPITPKLSHSSSKSSGIGSTPKTSRSSSLDSQQFLKDIQITRKTLRKTGSLDNLMLTQPYNVQQRAQ
ncbi:MAG: hypothetical protein QWI36_03380 [Wolbachia endosymbiont of Tyrophagus putrescentiae]|nr:hypothetical protein [Wolbachia endosymbiont of Tyrophagus putrescentiae]